MRIFQVLERSVNAGIPGGSVWLKNLHEPLRDMGHDVTLVPAELGLLARERQDATLRRQFSNQIWDAFEEGSAKQPYDLVFCYLTDGMVEPDVIDAIRATGALTTNFSCNNAHQFDNVRTISPHFDINLHSEHDTGRKFSAIGATPLWFQMAANPRYYYPKHLARTMDASFVGMNYALRADYIFFLLEQGIDVHAFGPGWTLNDTKARWKAYARRQLNTFRSTFARTVAEQSRLSAKINQIDLSRLLASRYPNNLHLPVTEDDMVRIYNQSSIVLGFLEVYDAHDPSKSIVQHLHLREFEAPMAGALYLTNYSDELAEHYIPDKEVLTFRNRHELLDKLRYYLSHPDKADTVRWAGHLRALRDHTWQQRFTTLFKQLSLPATAS